jgi:hypothetical protein
VEGLLRWLLVSDDAYRTVVATPQLLHHGRRQHLPCARDTQCNTYLAQPAHTTIPLVKASGWVRLDHTGRPLLSLACVKRLFVPLLVLKLTKCQDRLRTNIGKTQKSAALTRLEATAWSDLFDVCVRHQLTCRQTDRQADRQTDRQDTAQQSNTGHSSTSSVQHSLL